MLNIDPSQCIPGVLAELVNNDEARVSFFQSDRQMTITIDDPFTKRLLWRVEVLARRTAPTWHIKDYTDVAELRHRGIASEFCERLIQQAEEVGIKYITAHCSPESAAILLQLFGAVRAGDIPQEQRVQVFGRAELEDASVVWSLDFSLAIFICYHQGQLAQH